MQRAEQEGTRGGGWLFAGACVLALAALVGAYANSFGNSFHFDDAHVIEQNLYIRSLANVPRFFEDASTFSALPQNSTYRPLLSTTLALDYWLGDGLDPWQFHLTQLVLLVTLCVMVFFVALRIFDLAQPRARNRLAALLATTLFALHTTSTETMNAISARSEILSTLGVAGSFLVYFHVPRSRRLHLYLLPMVIGALAKTPAVMFAPLFLVYVLLFEKQLSLRGIFARAARPAVRAALLQSLPALIVGGAVFVVVESQNAVSATWGGGDRLGYLLTQAFVWLHYARLFVLPVGLTADTDWRLITEWYDTRVLAGVLFVALLARWAWVASGSAERRPVTFGIAWFALALLPSSSIVPLAEVANEHRVFFPYIGASLAVVWSGALLYDRWFAARPRARPALAAAAWLIAITVIGGHALGVHERNKVWRTEETLWRDVVEKSPANGRGLMNYGLTQMELGRYAEARQYFDRALVYNPNYATLEINLGIVTDRLGEHAAAEQHFQRALQLQPDYYASHSFYARWLAAHGRPADAIGHLERALVLSPADVSTRYQLLELYARCGRAADVQRLAEDTLELVPSDATALKYLNGPELLGPGPTPEAATPQTPASLLNDSLHLYQAGDYTGCIDAARKLLALQPDSAEAWNNIAAAQASLGRWDDAIAAAQQALQLEPDYELARNNLAWASAEKQRADLGVR